MSRPSIPSEDWADIRHCSTHWQRTAAAKSIFAEPQDHPDLALCERCDIISDTHGDVSDDVLGVLDGASIIVHAGDIVSRRDYDRLREIAPIYACLGNNDRWGSVFPPNVERRVHFFFGGLRWFVAHYERDLDMSRSDIGICGHTHRGFVREDRAANTLIMNPGSPSWPRGGGPQMGRIYIADGHIVCAQLIQL